MTNDTYIWPLAVFAGVLFVVVVFSINKTRKEYTLRKTALEWEVITGIQVYEYTGWLKAGIPIDQPITRLEFEKLARESVTRHRRNRNPWER